MVITAVSCRRSSPRLKICSELAFLSPKRSRTGFALEVDLLQCDLAHRPLDPDEREMREHPSQTREERR